MSTIREIALLIPLEYRNEILETNMIEGAVAVEGNLNMLYLAKIYKEYIEPDFSGDCSLCYARALNVFKQILPELIKLKKEQDLLGLD